MSTGFIGGKFLPLHQGHMYAIMKASTMVDKLYVVLSSSTVRDRELCNRDGIKYAPKEVRLSWMGELVHDLENVEIVSIEDSQSNDDYDWEEGSLKIKETIPHPIDYVFSSEISYNDIFSVLYPESKHIVLDPSRSNVNISATEIRQDLYKNWEFLPSYVRAFYTKKVVVVGTESCGKTTLVKKLAKAYNTNYCGEVGRKYCGKYSNRLTISMFDRIAMEHYILQEKLINESNRILFIDSEATITHYYLDMYYAGHSRLIEEIAKKQEYDLVIYLEPDVEWVDDGTRFSQYSREENNQYLKWLFVSTGVGFETISGNYEKRFIKAKELVDSLYTQEEIC